MGCTPSNDFKAQFIANLPELFEYYRKVVTYIKNQQLFKKKDAELQAEVDLYLLNPRSFDTKNMKVCAIDSTHKLHPVDYGTQKVTREWLTAACLRQHKFIEEFPFSILTYEDSLKHYIQFLHTCLKNPDRVIVPNKLADFMWHSHMQDGYRYKIDSQKMLGRILDHLDDIPEPKFKEYAKYTDQIRKKDFNPQTKKYEQNAASFNAYNKASQKQLKKKYTRQQYQVINYDANFDNNNNAEIPNTITNDSSSPQQKSHQKHYHHHHHHPHHHKDQDKFVQQKHSHHQHKNEKCENNTIQHNRKDHASSFQIENIKPAIIQSHCNHHDSHAHHHSPNLVAIETSNHHHSSHGGHATTTEANHHSSCGGHATTIQANHHSSCGGGGGHSSCGGGGHSSCGGGGASSCGGGGASSCGGGGGSSCGGG